MTFKEPSNATAYGNGHHLLYTIPAMSKGQPFEKLIAMFSLDQEGIASPNTKTLWIHKDYVK